MVGKDTKYSVPLFMTNTKYQLRSGKKPRLQASPQSMRKSVPGGEKSGVVVLVFTTVPSLPMLAVAPSPMPELAVFFCGT